HRRRSSDNPVRDPLALSESARSGELCVCARQRRRDARSRSKQEDQSGSRCARRCCPQTVARSESRRITRWKKRGRKNISRRGGSGTRRRERLQTQFIQNRAGETRDRPRACHRRGDGVMSAATLGQPLTRVDGKLKVIGAAKFSAEFDRPQLAYGALIQSTHANGRVSRIDLSSVKSAPGVITIITRENAPQFKPYPDQLTKKGAPGEQRLPLQDDEVHWSGQHLGIVVADTFERAMHAASLTQVTYEPAKPVVAPDELDESKLLAPEKFIGREELQVKRGDIAAALAT